MDAFSFITEEALKQVQPDMKVDEVGLLNAFDTNRELIYATASKVYPRGRKGSYDLRGADFRDLSTCPSCVWQVEYGDAEADGNRPRAPIVNLFWMPLPGALRFGDMNSAVLSASVAYRSHSP